jgi:tetratricopeptide (TPR) repeat protein
MAALLAALTSSLSSSKASSPSSFSSSSSSPIDLLARAESQLVTLYITADGPLAVVNAALLSTQQNDVLATVALYAKALSNATTAASSENTSGASNSASASRRNNPAGILAAVLAASSSSNGTNPKLLYLRGRALDCYKEYSAEAEKCLSKAVKLEPSSCDNWNALGRCFWKKNDLQQSLHCFKNALEQNLDDHRALIQLSMLLRQLPPTKSASRASNITESLLCAKSALKLDLANAEAWYVLGNAHVSSFFDVSHSVRDLDFALKAYNKSLSLEQASLLETTTKNGSSRSSAVEENSSSNNSIARAAAAVFIDERNPDLHYNRGEVLRYKMDYSAAIASLKTAKEIDPNLPTSESIRTIEHFIKRVDELVLKKGKMKVKRLKTIVAPLAKLALPRVKEGMVAQHTICAFTDLAEGDNPGKAIGFKVIMPLGEISIQPACFLVCDRETDCCVLSVYHLSTSFVKHVSEKDVFMVLEPNLVKVTHGDVEFMAVVVGDPKTLAVNGEIGGAKNNIFAFSQVQMQAF